MSKKKKKKLNNKSINDRNKKRPITASIALDNVNDKYSEYPSNGLTPRRLASIFKEADQGDIMRQMQLFEEMEEKDTHLFSQLQTRKLAVTGLEWKIRPYSDDEADEEIAEFISSVLKDIEDFDNIVLDMLDAIGKGISFLEIIWDYNLKSQCIIDNIKWIHPKKFYWDCLTDEIKVCTREYPEGIAIPDNKFVIHKYKARSGHDSRQGILRVVSWMYLFKNYDLKDWVAFCEVFGMPLRLGKYDVSASEDDKSALMQAIFNLGSDAAGIVPSTTAIDFVEANKTSTVDIYEKLARYCDEQMSKAILGQTLTSDSGGGSYAQSKTHDNVRHDLIKADCKALNTTIRRDIIRPLVEYNYGTEANVPYFEYDCQDEDALKEVSEIYEILSCNMGLEIPKSHVYKKFNIPVPEKGEEVIQPVSVENTKEAVMSMAMKKKPEKKPIEHADRMAEICVENSSGIFEEIMKPIFKIIDNCESMEELKEFMEDEKKVKKLYGEMENNNLSGLLEKGMYIASLIGRVQE